MLDHSARAELDFFRNHLDDFHGQLAQTAAIEVAVVSIVGPPEEFLTKYSLKGHLLNG